mgnify:CR=1 FL=1
MLLKQTKIVASISDRRCDVDFIKELFDSSISTLPTNKTESIIARTTGRKIPFKTNLFSFFVILSLLSVHILRLKSILHKVIFLLFRFVCRWVFKLFHKFAVILGSELVNFVNRA